jgi:hypothetical protein
MCTAVRIALISGWCPRGKYPLRLPHTAQICIVSQLCLGCGNSPWELQGNSLHDFPSGMRNANIFEPLPGNVASPRMVDSAPYWPRRGEAKQAKLVALTRNQITHRPWEPERRPPPRPGGGGEPSQRTVSGSRVPVCCAPWRRVQSVRAGAIREDWMPAPRSAQRVLQVKFGPTCPKVCAGRRKR